MIRSKNTKLENLFFEQVAALLHRAGFRYRKHYERIDGRPDIAFPKYRVAVFVDSSFWHGRQFSKWHGKLCGTYWPRKILRNMKRDRQVARALDTKGWCAIRFWDTDVTKRPTICASKLLRVLRRRAARLRGSRSEVRS